MCAKEAESERRHQHPVTDGGRRITRDCYRRVLEEAMSENPALTCGECVYWRRARGYQWGTCIAPLPLWACSEDSGRSPTIFPDDTMANDCDAFEDQKEGR